MGIFSKKKESLTEDEEKAVQETIQVIERAVSQHRVENGLDDQPDEEEEEATEELDELDEEVKIIIKDASIMVAIATMVAHATSAIPGFGPVASVVFGVAISSGLVAKIQGEMIKDIAKVYGQELSATNQQRASTAIYGLANGVAHGVKEVGARVATATTSKAISYIPVIGSVTNASVNMTVTYVIGYRAKAYFKLGEDEMQSWEDSVRAISGVDELKMATWMREAVSVIKKKAVQNVTMETPKRALNKLRNSIKAISAFRRPAKKEEQIIVDENGDDL
mmetsp:Transcript_3503/g.4003  ORF Transcript_3503/g.4003 Transcript_3503/m.4003 type:complete len:279 (-) Transcript_3503:126-962(-)